MRPKITRLEPGVDGAWYWTVEYDGVPGLDRTSRVERNFRTNRYGEGLWQGDRQILGTAQYRLPDDRKRARAKIYRDFVLGTDDYGRRI